MKQDTTQQEDISIYTSHFLLLFCLFIYLFIYFSFIEILVRQANQDDMVLPLIVWERIFAVSDLESIVKYVDRVILLLYW